MAALQTFLVAQALKQFLVAQALQQFLVAQASRLCCEHTVVSRTGETPVRRFQRATTLGF